MDGSNCTFEHQIYYFFLVVVLLWKERLSSGVGSGRARVVSVELGLFQILYSRILLKIVLFFVAHQFKAVSLNWVLCYKWPWPHTHTQKHQTDDGKFPLRLIQHSERETARAKHNLFWKYFLFIWLRCWSYYMLWLLLLPLKMFREPFSSYVTNAIQLKAANGRKIWWMWPTTAVKKHIVRKLLDASTV